MSDIDTMLAEVKRLDAEATSGPWYASHRGRNWRQIVCAKQDCPHTGLTVAELRGDPNTSAKLTLDADADLTAYYRTAAPLLAAEIERLRGEVEELKARRTIAGEHAMRYGMIDGSHHKQWVIDQMLRAMLGTEYAAWVAEANADDDYAEWSEGIAP